MVPYDRQRDASSSIAGFVFQALLTIDRWIDLRDEETLFCEYGEGIYISSKNIASGPSGVLEQVKHRIAPITLKTTGVAQALIDFAEHNSKDAMARLQFSTNAAIGRERGGRFPQGMPGIVAWTRLVSNELAPRERRPTISELKRILGGIRSNDLRPSQQEYFKEWRQLLRNEKRFAAYLQAVDWRPEISGLRVLPAALINRLVAREYVENYQQGRVALNALFFHVLTTLSQTGLKKLARQDFLEIVDRGVFNPVDHGLVNALMAAVADIPTVIDQAKNEIVDKVTSQVDRAITHFASLGVAQASIAPPPLADIPATLPAIFATRTRLLDELGVLREKHTYVTLTGETGSGKSVIARRAYDLHAGPKAWVSLSDKRLDQALSHIQTQVARWISESIDVGVWGSYSMGIVSLRQGILRLAETAQSKLLLVVDDLPSPLPEEMARVLISLVRATGGKGCVVAKSYREDARLDREVAAASAHLAVGPLFNEDVDGMLNQAGAPPELRTAQMLTLIAAVTSNHATLVAMTIDWLSKRGWRFGEAELTALFAGDPVKSGRTEAWLEASSVLDSSAKQLLYRLSLIGGEFGDRFVYAVAEAKPSLENASESLERLIGPFLIRGDANRYHVTALLRGIGQQALRREDRRNIHGAIAACYLAMQPLDADEASEVITHLYQAGDYRRYSHVLFSLLQSVKTASQARRVSWASSVDSTMQQIGGGGEIGLRLGIVTGQYRLLALLGRDVLPKYNEMASLISQARADNQGDQAMVLSALMTAGVFMAGPDSATAIRNAVRALRMVKSGDLIDPTSFEVEPDAILWLAASRISSVEGIESLLDAIQDLTLAERRSALSVPFACEMLQLAIEGRVHDVGQLPQNQRDWTSIDTMFDHISAVCQLEGVSLLGPAAARARAIMLADYKGDASEALAILNSSSFEDSSDLRFLEAYTRGVIVAESEDDTLAVAHFEEALLNEGESFSYFRLDALRRAGIGYARLGQYDAAIARYKAATNYTKPYDELMRPDRAEILSEMAWVYKAERSYGRQYGAMYAASHDIDLLSKAQTDRFFEAYWKLIYAYPWFWFGSAHPGAIYQAWTGSIGLVPGLFVRRFQPENSPPLGFSPASLFVLTGLAAARTHPRLARKAFERASTPDVPAPIPSFTLMDSPAIEARVGDPDDAVRLVRETISAFRALPDAPKIQENGRQLVWILVLGPAFMEVLCGRRSVSVLDELTVALNSRSPVRERRYWRLAGDYLRELSESFFNRELPKAVPAALSSDPVAEVASRVVRSVAALTHLKDGLSEQWALLIWLDKQGAQHMIPGFTQVLVAFWRDVATNRRFAVQSPDRFAERLERLARDEPLHAAYRLLRLTADSLGLGLPKELQDAYAESESRFL